MSRLPLFTLVECMLHIVCRAMAWILEERSVSRTCFPLFVIAHADFTFIFGLKACVYLNSFWITQVWPF
jgi:hypothetical protein